MKKEPTVYMIREIDFDLKLIAKLKLIKHLVVHRARKVLVSVETLFSSNVMEVDVSLQARLY